MRIPLAVLFGLFQLCWLVLMAPLMIVAFIAATVDKRLDIDRFFDDFCFLPSRLYEHWFGE